MTGLPRAACLLGPTLVWFVRTVTSHNDVCVNSSQTGFLGCSTPSCVDLPACLNCTWPRRCDYGQLVTVACSPLSKCAKQLAEPNKVIRMEAPCLYCWQTPAELHRCDESARRCRSRGGSRPPLSSSPSNCSVPDGTLCMGARRFGKLLRCDWTSGYKWSTAFALSVTLGGFGADRFYLGLWKSGMGKLFSFGGLGLWTLIDVVLVATGYLAPADGSAYVY